MNILRWEVVKGVGSQALLAPKISRGVGVAHKRNPHMSLGCAQPLVASGSMALEAHLGLESVAAAC